MSKEIWEAHKKAYRKKMWRDLYKKTEERRDHWLVLAWLSRMAGIWETVRFSVSEANKCSEVMYEIKQYIKA